MVRRRVKGFKLGTLFRLPLALGMEKGGAGGAFFPVSNRSIPSLPALRARVAFRVPSLREDGRGRRMVQKAALQARLACSGHSGGGLTSFVPSPAFAADLASISGHRPRGYPASAHPLGLLSFAALLINA